VNIQTRPDEMRKTMVAAKRRFGAMKMTPYPGSATSGAIGAMRSGRVMFRDWTDCGDGSC
jgi:hypothetical protein